MSDSKIIEKVKKLFAMANCETASENERYSAMRQAYAILAKHNLTEDDLEIKEEREKIFWKDYSNSYARQIVQYIAKLFFCKYYYSTGTTHTIIGKTSNVVTAQLLIQYVIGSIESESKKMIGLGYTKAYVNSFKKGVAVKIAIRVEDMIKVQETDTYQKSNGTSVVLKSVYDSEKMLNDEFVANEGLKIRSVNARKSSVYMNAYEAGQSFGDSISLNATIGNRDVLRIGK